MSAELIPKTGIESIKNLSREEAAGGMCSLRTLQLLNLVNNAPYGEVKEAQLSTPFGEVLDQSYRPFQKGISLGPAGELVVLPSDKASVTRLAYKHHESQRLLELWQLVERDGAKGECSYAVFMPALDNSLNIDYCTVVTVEDESSVASVHELLSEIPRTNAQVLDALKLCLTSTTTRNKVLYDLIKLDELIDNYRLNLDMEQMQVSSFEEEPSDPFVRQLKRIMGWARLGSYTETGLPTRTYLDQTTDTQLDVRADGLSRLWMVHRDLGTGGRSTQLGQLNTTDELVSAEAFIGNDSDVLEIAKQTLKIPEIVVSQELQDGVKAIFDSEGALNTWSVNRMVAELVRSYRAIHNTQAVIDLGTLDARLLNKRADGSFQEGSLFEDNQLGRVKATILAHSELDVFHKITDAYECHVIGAKTAFRDSSAARCVAENVTRAFGNSKLTDCLAIGGHTAFENSNSVGCIAENVYSAFSSTDDKPGLTSADKCIAVNVRDKAFWVADCKNCIAEHCRIAFTGFNANVVNSEARNPMLRGYSFNGRATNRRTGNKITGRLIGKGAAKARGRYRD